LSVISKSFTNKKAALEKAPPFVPRLVDDDPLLRDPDALDGLLHLVGELFGQRRIVGL